jgi:hypothetical protein
MNKFIELVRDQFTYGGKKYALSQERESTDVLFDRHGKNWLIGTIDKYTFRYQNLARERDLLKIACYMYILWLKRGFHIMSSGINDPAIDTNIKTKESYFSVFVVSYQNFASERGEVESKLITAPIKSISAILGKFSQLEWKSISEFDILKIFYFAYIEWKSKYRDVEIHDTDTNNK